MKNGNDLVRVLFRVLVIAVFVASAISLCGCSEDPASKRDFVEYKIVEVLGPDHENSQAFEDVLNMYAADGWRLIRYDAYGRLVLER